MKLNEKNLIDLSYEKRREILTKLLIGRNLEQ
jgi:ATP-dependent DNA ligase